jgi:hypothetical protein
MTMTILRTAVRVAASLPSAWRRSSGKAATTSLIVTSRFSHVWTTAGPSSPELAPAC